MPGRIVELMDPPDSVCGGRVRNGTGERREARSPPAWPSPRAVIKRDTALDPPDPSPRGPRPRDASRGKATSTLLTLGHGVNS